MAPSNRDFLKNFIIVKVGHIDISEDIYLIHFCILHSVKKLSTDALQHMVEGCQAVPQGDAATRLTANLRYIQC